MLFCFFKLFSTVHVHVGKALSQNPTVVLTFKRGVYSNYYLACHNLGDWGLHCSPFLQLDKLEKFRRKQHPVEAEAEGNDAEKVQESRANVPCMGQSRGKTNLFQSTF